VPGRKRGYSRKAEGDRRGEKRTFAVKLSRRGEEKEKKVALRRGKKGRGGSPSSFCFLERKRED